MKGYLLDENLPKYLLLAGMLPVFNVRELGVSLTDAQIWSLAKEQSWCIVSKDADFVDRILVADPPPWVIHLRIGNLRLVELRSIITRLWPQIEMLLQTISSLTSIVIESKHLLPDKPTLAIRRE